MTDYQLKLFLTAAQTRNFTAAAGMLYLTQPALSRQIASLENELGVKLFHRQNNLLELTAAGQLFYEKTLPIQAELDAAVRQVRDLGAGITGRLRLGLMEDQQLLPAVIEAVHALLLQYPGLEMDIRRCSWSDLLDGLDRDGLDLFQAPLYEGLPPERYAVLALVREPMYLAYHSRFLSFREEDLRGDLEHTGLPGGCPVFLVATSTYPEIIRKNLPLIRIAGAHFVDAVSSIPLYLATGMGASLINRSNMIALYPDVAMLPMDIEPVTSGLVWRRDSDSPALHRLTQILQQTAKENEFT